MIKGFAIVFYFASLFDGWCAENITPMPAKSGQLLLVTAPSWNATEGTLFLYSRSSKSAEWVVAGRKIPVVLGRTGLKWGLGLHPMIPSALVKREGDGGSPAGIFALDTAFGAKALPQLKWPWLAITRTHAAVDDARSRQYNRIVDSAKTKVDWQSFENMRPKGGEYDLGIVVKHN